MDFIPLANHNIFGESNLLRKMGWNYPSGALCLGSLSLKRINVEISAKYLYSRKNVKKSSLEKFKLIKNTLPNKSRNLKASKNNLNSWKVL